MNSPLSRLLLCTCIALTSLSVSAQSFGQTITVPTSTTPVFGTQPFTSTTSTNTNAGNILVSQDIYTNASAGSSSNYYFINNFSNYSCGLGYYRYGSRCYTCLGVPDDAYHTSPNTCTWSCNSGYYRSGNTCIANNPYPQPQPQYPSPTAQCGQSLNTCASGLFYDANDIGNFAYWICVGNNSAPVSCAAYKTITTPPPVQSCGIGQYPINNSCQTCFSKPYNSNYTTANSCDWSCVGGYHREANTCVADYIPTPQPQQCGIGQYPINNSCQTCFSKPQNSNYTTPNTCDWSCMSGYQREGNSCISVVATCGIGQYPIGNSCQSCFSKPVNSNYTTSNNCDFACTQGFRREGNSCVAEVATCGIGQYPIGNSCQSCFSKPNNSNYTTSNSCDWSCSYGYNNVGGSCVANTQCPSNSFGTYPSCVCQSGQTYSVSTNSCISNISCPSNSFGTYPSCTCTNGQVYNAGTNSCTSTGFTTASIPGISNTCTSTLISSNEIKTVCIYTGSDQRVTAPIGATSAITKAWGAGGGGRAEHRAGPGGYASSTIVTAGGTSYAIVVGKGGKNQGASPRVDEPYGFGGDSILDSYSVNASDGGGLAGVFTGSGSVLATDSSRAITVAGGGGGGYGTGPYDPAPGCPGNRTSFSGGMTTMKGHDTLSGQIALGGTGYSGGGGGLRGGFYATSYINGTCRAYGGTGYGDTILASEIRTANPPNTTDADYIAGVGVGGATWGSGAGGNGLVVITWYANNNSGTTCPAGYTQQGNLCLQNITLSPANSCKQILDRGQSTGSGVYTIQPQNYSSPVQVYCDMTTDGGGWTLIGQYNQQGATRYSEFNSTRNDFPLLGSNSIVNESSSTGSGGFWGLISDSLADALPFSSYRVEARDATRTYNIKINETEYIKNGLVCFSAPVIDLPSSEYWSHLTKINLAGTTCRTNGGTHALRSNPVGGVMFYSQQGENTIPGVGLAGSRVTNYPNYGFAVDFIPVSQVKDGVMRLWVK